MKERKLLIGAPVLILALVFAVMLTGCPEPEPTYEVWAGTINNAQFQSLFNTQVTLQVNGYAAGAITEGQFTYAKSVLAAASISSGDWTEGDLNDYFTDNGLSSSQAQTATNGVINNDHYFFAVRHNANNVNVLLK